ncbi:Cell fate regulator YlbF, YheA/YmcA/DUF963 family (controls sporulation, competence, biofilm development) [Melghirimyces thermohalophilus]|uniref:Cell fate regulator YlbF, YheA/YmcA/DUF963 family (Controls sporulation, competence, biofilm development) n=1 Tax=Melghirimyces thermohalophilus TaxID=1236220 RepID=A0A1G6ML73_9BACL|nr:YlbF family regulator [Melghirimyces thermohalophilus]SDC55695.1 Cell fate regulator YlbF, YheA/YmcA/DUF963 family (controls sporulation, competence, biofilm development) [Melghirimyces thermohalophilus]
MSAANPYDQADELARELQRSEAVSQLREVWGEVCQNPDQRRTMERFRELSMELQRLQLEGRRPEEAKEQELNRLLEEIRSHPTLQRYVEAEHRLSQMMNDIHRIVNAPIEEIYKK